MERLFPPLPDMADYQDTLRGISRGRLERGQHGMAGRVDDERESEVARAAITGAKAEFARRGRGRAQEIGQCGRVDDPVRKLAADQLRRAQPQASSQGVVDRGVDRGDGPHRGQRIST